MLEPPGFRAVVNLGEKPMFRSGFRALIAAIAVASTLAVMAAPADARIGGGFSSGSRRSRTFSAPPSTSTAPSASPLHRTTAQPSQPGFNQPGLNQPAGGGLFGGRGLFGGGLLGGLAAGFIGAGLFGLLFGHGLFGGLGGGIFSILGLIIQIALIVFIARLLWGYFQRRNQPAYAGGNSLYRDAPAGMGSGLGSGLGLGLGGNRGPAGPAQRSDTVGITGADYDAFERALGEVQAAYSNEDIGALRARV